MRQWAFIFLIVTGISAIIGFGTVPKSLSIAGRLLFLIFLTLTILTLIRVIFTNYNISNISKGTIMNELKIKGNWNEKKGKLKQEYAELTDNDLTYAEGKEEELVGRVQQRLGTSKEEARNIIRRA